MTFYSSSRTRKVLLGAAIATVFAAGVSAQPAEQAVSHAFSPSQPIPGRYIVVFKDRVGNPAAEAANVMRGSGGQLHHTYSSAVKGFAATMPDAAMRGLRNHPSVDYIEQDQTVSLSTTQSGATWGLDRIDEQARLLNSFYTYNYTGAGVNAYIIDSGLRLDHTQFTGRVLAGFSSVPDANGTNDCNGHGTHVAGTIGGTTWGVAKQVSITPVRVLNCTGSGSWSGVIAGIDWVANNRVLPAVANMSLGGGVSSSVNAAVAGAVNKGVVMVVAAGNSNANACNYSPASETSAITVGATTSGDVRASYSNYGTCVDVFAPGSSITSSWYTGASATNTISGTSMASPHVAGVAALVAEANPSASPAAVAAFIVANATPNLVGSAGTGSPNLLLFSLGTGSATEPPKPVIAIKGITGTSAKSGKNWRATATVTVRNVAGNAAMSGVTVSGSFAPGLSVSCLTSASGTCSMGSGTISYSIPQTVFTVTGASGSNMIYDSTQNQPAQITIHKP